MHLLDLLRKTMILPSLEASEAEGCIRSLTKAMVEEGCASPEYAEDVIRRERTFPTGLPTEPIGVAIPHADPDHLTLYDHKDATGFIRCFTLPSRVRSAMEKGQGKAISADLN